METGLSRVLDFNDPDTATFYRNREDHSIKHQKTQLVALTLEWSPNQDNLIHQEAQQLAPVLEWSPIW